MKFGNVEVQFDRPAPIVSSSLGCIIAGIRSAGVLIRNA